MSTAHLLGIDLSMLANQMGQPCLSIFMPTGPGSSQTPRDQLTLKKLLGQAESDLNANHVPPTQVEAMIKPVYGLLDRDNFWKSMHEGLAIFCSPVSFVYYKLPQTTPEIVVVGHRFYLKALLPLLRPDGLFYLLALSKNQVRFIRGTRFTAKELTLPEGVPPNLAATAHFRRADNTLQYHSGPGPVSGSRPTAVYYGRGGREDVEKNDLELYCSQIETGLRHYLADEKVPLVLAGVNYLTALYRQVNTYPHLVEQTIPGNPDDFSSLTLTHKAWPLVEPFFREQEETGFNRYAELAGTGFTSTEISEIVPAAEQGRVGTLFVAEDQQLWGYYDAGEGEVHTHLKAAPGDEDLLDLVATKTFLSKGAVFTRPTERMPEHKSIAAIFRY
ncbi:MAG: hypothetical protein J0I20_25390 [Chloroflexi bacterium]|nr:hypothetical protein [Chloroflexota bacterium]OJW01884.1 MAG: hypothetical protein BGO39_28470 [Chloroflexi bacterium 54-19]